MDFNNNIRSELLVYTDTSLCIICIICNIYYVYIDNIFMYLEGNKNDLYDLHNIVIVRTISAILNPIIKWC